MERGLLGELDAVIDPLLLPWAFAYRRGLGVRDALACLVEARDAGAAWVARADIDDCFDRTRGGRCCAAARRSTTPRRWTWWGGVLERPVTGDRVPVG